MVHINGGHARRHTIDYSPFKKLRVASQSNRRPHCRMGKPFLHKWGPEKKKDESLVKFYKVLVSFTQDVGRIKCNV